VIPVTGKREPPLNSSSSIEGYDSIVSDLVDLVEAARLLSARSVNAIMTATYWEIGRRIVKSEQQGKKRAEYGEALLEKLSSDLTARFGRGFGARNLRQMRQFFLTWPEEQIRQALSAESQSVSPTTSSTEIWQTVSAKSEGSSSSASVKQIARYFPLSWSHYVRLMALSSEEARRFYETEALRCGWSIRQLDRQIMSQFYERTALSRNKTSMLRKAGKAGSGDLVSPDEEIKDPFVLEFLGLKDEYSESDLEEALILHLEAFLLELGGDFAFVARQRRLRIGDEWYRVDLVFFHRRLRSLIIIDLKLGRFTHSDVGQMHLYLNYAKEHWSHEGENPPVGVILCAQKDEAVAHYALEGLSNKVLAREYLTVLPSEKALVQEIEKARRELGSGGSKDSMRQKRGL
jgi:predicted nuclease of restriction endonuclease-like (RecB) superfamily